jgi:hypothetical protein
MSLRLPLTILAVACAATAQKYAGPKPAKPDLPYLKHASTLLATEAVEAKPRKKKDDTVYWIDGANSPVRTPLAAPIFLFDSARIDPANLQLFPLESKNGHRELTVRPSEEAIRIEVTPLGGTDWKIEPSNGLDPGEYALLAGGANQMFCFAVF